MNKNINPREFGITSKAQLEMFSENHIGIRKILKSRIIGKDIEKIVEMANQIRNVNPDLKITLVCRPNICSKSLKMLDNEKIGVCFVE